MLRFVRPPAFQALAYYDGGAGLRSIALIQRQRLLPNRLPTETAYFVSSLPADARRILHVTRAHWAIENTFHWTLDGPFAEDASPVRLDNAPEICAVGRHVAFNLRKHHPAKASLKPQRCRAALDDAFLFAWLTPF